ncbi:MAG: winged helix-turn-helix domain-containing protein [Bacteroides sp.]|nr:winged helix-turn-helix domain-containing protein [Bacteroides sp.]
MLKEKAGENAGKIWTALSEQTEGLTAKQIKKATKLVDKDLYLGLGWLLREDKVTTSEVESELFVKLV